LEKISPERSKKKETVFPTRATMNSQTSRTVKIIFKVFPDIKVQQITSKCHIGPKRTTREAKKTRKEQCRTLRSTRNQSWRSQTEERTPSFKASRLNQHEENSPPAMNPCRQQRCRLRWRGWEGRGGLAIGF
jgi:hypothetical protein